MSKRVLVFCPEAVVVPHLACAAIVGRTLMELGHDVRFAACDRLFERCVGKDSINLPPGLSIEAAASLCKRCTNIFGQIVDAYKLNTLDLRPYASAEIAERARDILAPFNDDLGAAEYAGIKFGKLCYHDLILCRKILLANGLNDFLKQHLRESLLTTLKSYLMIEEVLRREHFDLILVNGQYAPNMGLVRLAQQHGIQARILHNISHLNVDRRFIVPARTEGREVGFDLIAAWPEWRENPLTEGAVAEVANDVMFRTRGVGSHVYSAGRTGVEDLRDALGVDKGRKLVVAFTSSLDEQDAQAMLAEGMERQPRHHIKELFNDQVSWLRFLVDHYANRDNIQLVIRIHPREDANRREDVRSMHLDLLIEALRNVPPNVTVIQPRDSVSSYDLIEVADLVLTSWSTLGLECARIGIPVVGCYRGLHNIAVGDFIATAASLPEYVTVMERMLYAPPSLNRVRLAFRWYFAMKFMWAMNFCDVMPRADLNGLPPFQMSRSAGELEAEVFGTAPPPHIARLQRLRLTPRDPEAELREGRALRTALRNIVHFLFTNAPRSSDFALKFRYAPLAEAADIPLGKDEAVLVVENNMCRYRVDDVDVVKYLPVAVRLGALAAQGLSAAPGWHVEYPQPASAW